MDYALFDTKAPSVAWTQMQDKIQKKRKSGKKKLRSKSEPKVRETLGRACQRVFELFIKTTVACSLAFGAYLGYDALTTSSRFAVAQVVFTGTQSLRETQLTEWMRTIKGQNIFQLDLDQMAHTISQNPWVREVSVERVLPNRVNVFLHERAPYARIAMDQTYLLDNFGVLLDKANGAFEHLPLIQGLPPAQVQPGDNVVTPKIIAGLNTMYHFNRLDSFREDPVHTLRIIGDHRAEFITEKRGLSIFIDLNTVQNGFDNLKIIFDAIDTEIDALQSIDLSFRDKIIVQHKKGGDLDRS